jgi:hypothetical protein
MMRSEPDGDDVEAQKVAAVKLVTQRFDNNCRKK